MGLFYSSSSRNVRATEWNGIFTIPWFYSPTSPKRNWLIQILIVSVFSPVVLDFNMGWLPWVLISESGVFQMLFPSPPPRRKGPTSFFLQKNLLLLSGEWAQFCHWQSQERKREAYPCGDSNSLGFQVASFSFWGLSEYFLQEFLWGVSLGIVHHYPVLKADSTAFRTGLLWHVALSCIRWVVLTDWWLYTW